MNNGWEQYKEFVLRELGRLEGAIVASCDQHRADMDRVNDCMLTIKTEISSLSTEVKYHTKIWSAITAFATASLVTVLARVFV